MDQYKRVCSLVVASSSGDGLELSHLRVSFSISKNDAQTPNSANIKVWNLSPATIEKIKKEFTQITLTAGYVGNARIIFSGNIKRSRVFRENIVDKILEIEAGDGDLAYNSSTVSTTLAAGSIPSDHAETITASMRKHGVVAGEFKGLKANSLPRGKVFFGMARDLLREVAYHSGASWSIQDGKVIIGSLAAIPEAQAVVLNSRTGLIGVPEQTGDGIKARCLLNPLLKIGTLVKISEGDIQEGTPKDVGDTGLEVELAKIQVDGVYKIISLDYTGDTRGNEWFCEIVCLGVNESAPEGGKVKING